MTLFMRVDVKHNELPLSVHDSQKDMARHYGVRKSAITSEMNRAMKKGCKCQWVMVEVDEDDVG